MRNEGYDLNSLLAAESINRADLVNDQAVLPTGPFRVFLRPKQTKSGTTELPYKEVRALIQSAIASDGDKAKAHFNVGKNYTTKKGPELNELWSTYSSKGATTAEPKKAAPVKQVKEVAPKKAEKVKEVKQTEEISELASLEEAKRLVESVTSVDTTKVVSKISNLISKLLGEGVEEQLSEEEVLAKEAKAFMEGY